MPPPRNYADPAQTTYITASVLRFGIESRRLQNDQGICIHVFGGPDDQQDEVLRFDCFERQPHYHYAWSKNTESLSPLMKDCIEQFGADWCMFESNVPVDKVSLLVQRPFQRPEAAFARVCTRGAGSPVPRHRRPRRLERRVAGAASGTEH